MPRRSGESQSSGGDGSGVARVVQTARSRGLTGAALRYTIGPLATCEDCARFRCRLDDGIQVAGKTHFESIRVSGDFSRRAFGTEGFP